MLHPKTYILRYHTSATRRSPRASTRLWTVQPADVVVQYQQRVRRTGQRIQGLGPVVKDAGLDKSTVSLRSRSSDGARNGRGLKSSINWLTFKLLQRQQHIRILTDEDLAALDAIDARISIKEAELKALRDERFARVEQAWASAEKVDIDELEELADA